MEYVISRAVVRKYPDNNVINGIFPFEIAMALAEEGFDLTKDIEVMVDHITKDYICYQEDSVDAIVSKQMKDTNKLFEDLLKRIDEELRDKPITAV